MSSPGQLVTQGAIQGESFLAIEAGIAAVRSKHPDISKCKIEVFRQDSSLVTVFVESSQAGETSTVAVRAGTELDPAEVSSITSGHEGKLIDSIPGNLASPIRTAEKVFQEKHAHDLAEYRITVVSDKNSLTVIFTDKNARPRGRGNPGALPAFEVELKPDDLRVLRSNFVR